MKRIAKKTMAILLALVLCCSMAGCYNENLSWAAEKDGTQLSIGAYIYYLSVSYSSAAEQVTADTEVLKAEIDGMKAEDWIRQEAQGYVNRYYWLDSEMQRLGLTLDEAAEAEAQRNTDSYWSYYGETLESYGVSKASFHTAYSLYNQKFSKVFEAMYGEGGERAVSDEELKDYFEENYYNYEYFTVPTVTVKEDGTTEAMSEEEIAALTKELEAVAKKIQAGTLTTEDAAKAQVENEEESTYGSGVRNLTDMGNAFMPTAFMEAIQDMKNDEARVVEAYNYLIVMHKLPISDKTEESLENARLGLTINLKYVEYSDLVREQAQGITGITMNDAALRQYGPAHLASMQKNGTIAVETESTTEE